jgi:hypothetical protein
VLNGVYCRDRLREARSVNVVPDTLGLQANRYRTPKMHMRVSQTGAVSQLLATPLEERHVPAVNVRVRLLCQRVEVRHMTAITNGFVIEGGGVIMGKLEVGELLVICALYRGMARQRRTASC